MKIPLIFLSLMALCYAKETTAQQAKDYSNHPYWIEMMDDTTANYFETEKAFTEYWQNRQKPVDEDELFANAGNDSDEVQPNIPYSFEYKKFKQWEIKIAPFVLDNGQIMYPTQQLQLMQDSRR